MKDKELKQVLKIIDKNPHKYGYMHEAQAIWLMLLVMLGTAWAFYHVRAVLFGALFITCFFVFVIFKPVLLKQLS